MRVTANGSVDSAYQVNVAGAALDVFVAAPDSQGRLFYLSTVSSSLTVRRVDTRTPYSAQIVSLVAWPAGRITAVSAFPPLGQNGTFLMRVGH